MGNSNSSGQNSGVTTFDELPREENLTKLNAGVSCGQCTLPKGYKEAREEGDQKYEELFQKCLQEKRMYQDPEFPADISSMGGKQFKYRNIRWMRPKEISQEAKLVVHGVQRGDVRQGELGNCWFASSLVTLTMHECLFDLCVPEDQNFDSSRYCGIFRCLFCYFGEWTMVIVDDRLPVDESGELIYISSQDVNEFWAPLVEKCYAKLHKCYANLEGGLLSEGNEELTGGMSESYANLTSSRYMMKKLSQKMLAYNKMSCLMTCGTSFNLYPWKRQGLVSSHAYSVTSVDTIKFENREIILVRVRNPWGKKEWMGPWSDGDTNWDKIKPADKNRLHVKFVNDGEFWMDISDFFASFAMVDVCHVDWDHLIPDNPFKHLTKLKEFKLKGKWDEYEHHLNCIEDWLHELPQFFLDIQRHPNSNPKGIFTLLAVVQDSRDRQYGTIGFSVYRLRKKPLVALKRDFFKSTEPLIIADRSASREIVKRKYMQPGSYCIIPYMDKPPRDTEFLIRVFTMAPFRAQRLQK